MYSLPWGRTRLAGEPPYSTNVVISINRPTVKPIDKTQFYLDIFTLDYLKTPTPIRQM